MSKVDTPNSESLTFSGALTILFIGLKLGEVIDWNWFLVILPILAGPLAAALFLALVAFAKTWVGKPND